MRICIDGNDGVGKTTLITRLKELMPEHEYQDRGYPTYLTSVDEAKLYANIADVYVILSCPVAVSLERLTAAGKDMNEHWHKPETLEHYHARFAELAAMHCWPVLDATRPVHELADEVCRLISAPAPK